MTNKVLSLSFNSQFFLSPNYKGFVVREYEDPKLPILVTGDEMERPDSPEFVSVFENHEMGEVPFFNKGDYRILTNYIPSTGEISFNFFNLSTSKTEQTIKFDPKKYLKDYSEVYSAWIMANPMGALFNSKEKQEAETGFSVEYLKSSFGQILQGNDAFWERFHGDFDVATAPLNAHFDRQLNNLPPKKVCHLTHAEYQELKPKLG